MFEAVQPKLKHKVAQIRKSHKKIAERYSN